MALSNYQLKLFSRLLCMLAMPSACWCEHRAILLAHRMHPRYSKNPAIWKFGCVALIGFVLLPSDLRW